MDSQSRIINLEEKLAHLEKYVGDLDEVIRDLAGKLDAQGKNTAAVKAILEQHLAAPGSASDSGDGGQGFEDDRPPHW